jgi:hypothetical protein
MSEPIPDVPDVVAVRALPALVELLHTDPLARPLVPAGTFDSTWFYVHRGALEITCHDSAKGGEQLSAARALFGGTVELGPSYSSSSETHVLTTTWQEVPLTVRIEIKREDEVAELRKQLADLQAAQAAAGLVVAE